MTTWRDSPAAPSISLVVCTRERPQLLARAVRAAVAQDYPGTIECVVVFDQSEPSPIDVELPEGRSLVITTNANTPGLAGARNTGIARATGELVAFCDDDDEWTPAKLSRQVALFRAFPHAVGAATGITIITEDGEFVREAPVRATHADFVRSRITAIHPSTFLFHRRTLVDAGAVDENLPHGYGEDYELLLRLTRLGDFCSVPDPLVNIYWNRPSFFASRWEGIAAGLAYILDRFEDSFATDRVGRARVRGQVAFSLAALGRRRAAVRWAFRTLRDSPRQLRGYAAIVVAARLISAERLVRYVQARGEGL